MSDACQLQGSHTDPVTRDREHPEFTSAMHFLPLTTASITGSTSFNLNGKRVVLTSHPCFHFTDSFSLGAQFCCRDNSAWLVSLWFLTLLHCIQSLARWFRPPHLKQVTSLWPVLWRFRVCEAWSGRTAVARCSSLVSMNIAQALSSISLKVKVSNLVDDQRSPLTWLGSPLTKALFIQHSGGISSTSRTNRCKSVRNSLTVSGWKRRVVNCSNATNESVP